MQGAQADPTDHVLLYIVEKVETSEQEKACKLIASELRSSLIKVLIT